MKLLVGIVVLTAVILSVVPAVRAAEPSELDASGKTTGEPFSPDAGASVNLPFQTNENFSLGAVTESSTDAAEAAKLAKELANRIASLISAPFQANEDWGYGSTGTGYKFTLNIEPVIPISIRKSCHL